MLMGWKWGSASAVWCPSGSAPAATLLQHGVEGKIAIPEPLQRVWGCREPHGQGWDASWVDKCGKKNPSYELFVLFGTSTP